MTTHATDRQSGGALPRLSLLFPLLVFLTGFFSGCSKSGDGPDEEDPGSFYIKFKVNGEQKDYRANAICNLLPLDDNDLHPGVFQAYNSLSTPGKDIMSVTIWEEDPIAEKAYYNADSVLNKNGIALPQVLMTYVDVNEVGFVSMRKPASSQPPLSNIVTDVEFRITTIAAGRVAGSFSGTLHRSTDGTFTDKAIITEGTFNLQRF